MFSLWFISKWRLIRRKLDPLWKIIALKTILLLLTWCPDEKLLLNILIRVFITSLRRLEMAESTEQKYQNSCLKGYMSSHGKLLASHSFKLLIYTSFQWAKWQPTPVFMPGKSHELRSLVGYSPRGHKQSETTERFHFHFQCTILSILIKNISTRFVKIMFSYWLSVNCPLSKKQSTKFSIL